MECELSLIVKGGNEKLTISDMRKMIEKDPSISLKEKIQGGKLKLQWPHARPEPTGEVRAKLIHDRMHKKNPIELEAKDIKPSKLKNVSGIFTLIITIPCVAFSLNMFFRWLGFSENSSKTAAIIGGLISFFVELGLIIIHAWKEEQQQKVAEKMFKYHIH